MKGIEEMIVIVVSEVKLELFSGCQKGLFYYWLCSIAALAVLSVPLWLLLLHWSSQTGSYI